jgi:thioredoxin 1
MIKITEQNFEDEIIKSSQPMLLDFGAAWCGPCKMIEPVILKLENRWKDKARFGKVDVDESPELAMRYQVMGVPTVLLIVGGEIKERITGFMPENRLIDKFGPHLDGTEK